MAQNIPDDEDISDSDYYEIKKPSESAELIPVGASNDDLKSYLDERLKPSADDFDSKIQPEHVRSKAMHKVFLRYRGQVYEETLRQARTNKATRSDTERNDDERIEDFFVGVIEDDFKKYANGRPDCEQSECWAARESFVNIVRALIRPRGADDRKSLKEGLQQTSLSKGLLALAIAAENNDLTMVDALKDIAVADERFMESSEPALFSFEEMIFHHYCEELVYELYPSHEVWLCPIEAAARLGHVEMVTKLIELRKRKVEADQEKRKKELSERVTKHELGEATMKEELSKMMTKEKSKWRRPFDWAVRMGHTEVVKLFIDGDYIVDLNEVSNVRRLLYSADVESYGSRQTPLALAVLSAKFEIVKFLCTCSKGDLRTDAKNWKRKSAIQMAFNESRYGARTEGNVRYKIWEQIMKRVDSRREVNKLTEERKVHVDAVNAILVGTALIATATFAGWLSPPLGYSSPPGMDGPFASVEGHPVLEKFWVFNSLSFFFSIATFMVGANVALPPPHDIYIGDVVQSLRWKLRLAYYLVSAAVLFVIGAFACAGFAVLPPIPKYTVNMAVTVGIGVTVVAVAVVLSSSFAHMLPTGWQQFKRKMKFHCWQQSKDEMESSDDD